jgi:hypothetical protein
LIVLAAAAPLRGRLRLRLLGAALVRNPPLFGNPAFFSLAR